MTDPSIEILRAGSDDLPSVVRLFEAESREGEYPALAEHQEAWVSESRKTYDFTRSDSYWLLVARLGGELVGHAAAVRIPKLDARRGALYLDELYVLTEFRRRGIAKELVRAVIDLASESDYHLVRLVTAPENRAARALYRSLGISEDRPVFYELTL